MAGLNDEELKKLNKAQLIALLNSIDRKKQPRDAAKIQSYLQSEDILSRNFLHRNSAKSRLFPGKSARALPAWSHLVLAFILFLTALYIHLTGKLPVIGYPLTDGGSNFTKISFVIIFVGSGVLSMVHYFQDRNKS